jgi:hypothetical protein
MRPGQRRPSRLMLAKPWPHVAFEMKKRAVPFRRPRRRINEARLYGSLDIGTSRLISFLKN